MHRQTHVSIHIHTIRLSEPGWNSFDLLTDASRHSTAVGLLTGYGGTAASVHPSPIHSLSHTQLTLIWGTYMSLKNFHEHGFKSYINFQEKFLSESLHGGNRAQKWRTTKQQTLYAPTTLSCGVHSGGVGVRAGLWVVIKPYPKYKQ